MNTFNEYQETTAKYRLNTYTPEACVMGFLSEAGEVAGVFQKMILAPAFRTLLVSHFGT